MIKKNSKNLKKYRNKCLSSDISFICQFTCSILAIIFDQRHFRNFSASEMGEHYFFLWKINIFAGWKNSVPPITKLPITINDRCRSQVIGRSRIRQKNTGNIFYTWWKNLFTRRWCFSVESREQKERLMCESFTNKSCDSQSICGKQIHQQQAFRLLSLTFRLLSFDLQIDCVESLAFIWETLSFLPNYDLCRQFLSVIDILPTDA